MPRPPAPPLHHLSRSPQLARAGVWARVLAWPGMLTLLSVLAVLTAQPPPSTAVVVSRLTSNDLGPPPLPELRPAVAATPQPAPSTVPPPALPLPVVLPRPAQSSLWVALPAKARSPRLEWLGRRQTDGG